MEQQPQSQNTVQLLGHLGQDVELREIANGKKLARTSLATNEFKNSEKVTSWHNLVAWGTTAEEMGTLQKGQKVMIEGKIQYRTYENKAGEKRYQTDILVNSFKLIAKEEKVA